MTRPGTPFLKPRIVQRSNRIANFAKAIGWSLAIATLTLTTPQVSAFAQTAQLQNIRSANHTKYVRIVLDLDQKAGYTILESEGTLILELTNFDTSGQSKSFSKMGRVKGISITSTGDRTARVSLDIDAPVRPRVSVYTPDHYGGHRIVIDLWPAKEAEELAPSTQVEAKPPIEGVKEEVPIEVAKVETLPQENTNPLLGMREEADPSSDPFTLDQTASDTFFDEGVAVVEASPPPTPPAPQKKVPEPAIEDEKREPAVEVLAEAPPQSAEEAKLMTAALPEDPIARAEVYLASGKASDACETIAKNFPQGTWNIKAMLIEGRCLTQLKEYSDAASLYTELLAFDPLHKEARFGLASAQVQMRDMEAAYHNYQRLLRAVTDKDLREAIQRQMDEIEQQPNFSVN